MATLILSCRFSSRYHSVFVGSSFTGSAVIRCGLNLCHISGETAASKATRLHCAISGSLTVLGQRPGGRETEVEVWVHPMSTMASADAPRVRFMLMPPNVPDQRPGAKDVRYATEASSPGPLDLVC